MIEVEHKYGDETEASARAFAIEKLLVSMLLKSASN